MRKYSQFYAQNVLRLDPWKKMQIMHYICYLHFTMMLWICLCACLIDWSDFPDECKMAPIDYNDKHFVLFNVLSTISVIQGLGHIPTHYFSPTFLPSHLKGWHWSYKIYLQKNSKQKSANPLNPIWIHP